MLPTEGKGWGRGGGGRSVWRRVVTIPTWGPPAPPAAIGWDRARPPPGWGGGRGGTQRPRRHPLRPVNDIPATGAPTRPGGSSTAHAPQASRDRLARLPARPRERRGRPGSPVRALAPPSPGATRLPAQGSAAPRPRFRPRSPALPLTGSQG